MASPVVVATSVVNGSAVTSISISPPAGIINNDILIAFIYSENSSVSVDTVPSGFTLAVTVPAAVGTRISVYWKLASSESGNYAWGVTGASWLGGWMVNVRFAYPTGSPIDVIGSGNTSTGTGAAATAITTTVRDTTIFYVCGNAAGGTATPPGGMTEVIDQSGMYLATVEQVAAGTTGTLTATLVGSSEYSCVALAVKGVIVPFTIASQFANF